jgi:hypothetical protein
LPSNDVQSNPNEQVAHAVSLQTCLKLSARVAKKTKMVAQLMTITGFTRVKVLQLGGRLADQQLVHETKRDGQTAHAKDRYLAAKESSRYVSSYPNRD